MKKIVLVTAFLIPALYALAQVNLNNGLVAYYPFIGNTLDISGNGNHVTFNNATPAPDRFGNPNSAYYFNGINNLMVVPNSPSLNPQYITLAAIVKPMGFYQGPCHGNVILNKGNNDFNQQSRYRMRFDDNIYTNQANCGTPVPDMVHQNFYGDFGGNGAAISHYLPYVALNQWFCVVYTYDGATAKFYVNGTLVASKATSIPYVPGPEDLYFGSLNNPSFPYWFNGVIDDIRIYNRALNTAEVSALCESTTALCTGTLGDPVVNISFGAGNNPGPALASAAPGATTSYGFVSVTGNPATPTPVDGQYTITNNVPQNAAWFSGLPDHTPGDVNGYMAFYNSSETAGQVFYQQRVDNLCPGNTYEFASWVANCLDPTQLIGINPDISFIIETTGGVQLATYTTGPIEQTRALFWKQYGFYFTLPATESSVVLKMINNAVGGNAQPGNDLAIDDITFRPCGPNLNASFSSTQQVDTFTTCEGQPVNLYGLLGAGYANPAFRWQTSSDNLIWVDAPNSNNTNFSVNPAPSTNYYYYRVVAADGANIGSANCRIFSNTLVLKVNAAPQGALKGDTVCINTPGHFSFTALQGTAPFTITYRDPSGATFVQANVAATASFATQNPVTANTVFTLVSIRDANGCERLANFNDPTITISLRQVVFQAPTATQTTCQNTAVSLSGNNGSSYLYLWSPATYLNDPTTQNPVSTPANTITYTLRLTEPVCNTDSNFQVTVNVNPNPVITVQKTNDINCKQDFAQLNATGGTTYSWSPATGLNSTTIANPIATPAVTTTYTVKATNSLGCNSTETVTVSVDYSTGKSIFEVPNAFTPNNDGRNDCFGIRNWNTVTILDFSIYNRWGQLVFTTKNRAECWDGRVNGILQPTGGYTYVIRTSSPCGNVEKKGIVMLIR